MANRKLTMRKTIETVRSSYDLGLSMRRDAQRMYETVGKID